MHVNKLSADLNYHLEQYPWTDRLPSKNPTGGLAWGSCVYIWMSVCMYHRYIVTVILRKKFISIGIWKCRKNGGNFKVFIVGLRRRKSHPCRGLGQPVPTAGSGAPPQYVCLIYFKQYIDFKNLLKKGKYLVSKNIQNICDLNKMMFHKSTMSDLTFVSRSRRTSEGGRPNVLNIATTTEYCTLTRS